MIYEGAIRLVSEKERVLVDTKTEQQRHRASSHRYGSTEDTDGRDDCYYSSYHHQLKSNQSKHR